MVRTAAVLCLLVTLFAASAAQAHRLKVFAYSDGETIFVEAMFSKDSPAKHCQVNVLDHTGATLATGNTDGTGLAEIAVPEEASGDLRIEVDGGEGHAGEWLLEEAEYK